MESKDELKEIDIKNRTCYYFDDIRRDINIHSGNTLLDKKNIKHTKYFNLW